MKQRMTSQHLYAAAADAGNRYMREHPGKDGSLVWTQSAYNAASAEFRRICKELGISPEELRL